VPETVGGFHSSMLALGLLSYGGWILGYLSLFQLHILFIVKWYDDF